MAQFKNQVIPADPVYDEGLGNMGKPIPDFRKDEAYRTCRQDFGLPAEKAFSTVQGISHALEQDRPYEALEMGTRYVDLTGVYRLFAVLLTHTKEE